MKLIMTVGLPASAKSTYARERSDKEGLIRVNRDDLRREHYPDEKHPVGYNFKKTDEKHVTELAHAKIVEAFNAGYSVICDDTNLTNRAVNSLTKLANEHAEDIEIEIVDHFLDVPLEELLRRNFNREQRVPQEVIMNMWDQHVAPTLRVENDPSLPSAVIVDVDGTVAEMIARRPYDWDKVSSDRPKQFVINIVNSLPSDVTRIVMTGRDGVCEADTRQWLDDNGLVFDEFYIRAEKDQRSDTIVKREMFDAHVAGKYYVQTVFDDRLKMVRMWHDMGFDVLNVGKPNASF